MMTFEEYREIVFEKLREMLSPFPKEEVEEYIKSMENDVKRSYNEGVELTEHFGTNRVNPNGYAYGLMMLF